MKLRIHTRGDIILVISKLVLLIVRRHLFKKTKPVS